MAKKPDKYSADGNVRRVIPLGGGTWAYVFDANGKTHHVERDSAEFYALINHLNEELNGRGDRELERLGWAVEADDE